MIIGICKIASNKQRCGITVANALHVAKLNNATAKKQAQYGQSNLTQQSISKYQKSLAIVDLLPLKLIREVKLGLITRRKRSLSLLQ
jgi:hypothetical protein